MTCWKDKCECYYCGKNDDASEFVEWKMRKPNDSGCSVYVCMKCYRGILDAVGWFAKLDMNLKRGRIEN